MELLWKKFRPDSWDDRGYQNEEQDNTRPHQAGHALHVVQNPAQSYQQGIPSYYCVAS
mgnify:CR=1 FL=1